MILIYIFCNANSTIAQNKLIYGKITKNDGSVITGTTSLEKNPEYQGQVLINSYTGGSDNNATIEIEVPTSSYMADFRNMMNTSPKIQKVLNERVVSQVRQKYPIARVIISISNAGYNLKLLNRIILEDVLVESCTDNVSSGTSKIKLKANRIGWVYVERDAGEKVSAVNKSGWDNISKTAWTSFDAGSVK